MYGAEQLLQSKQAPQEMPYPQRGNGTTGTPTRDTAQQAFDEQEKRLAELHQMLSEIESRLNVVLAPPPSNSSLGDPSPEPPTPFNLVDRARLHNRVISAAVTRLAGLAARLQL